MKKKILLALLITFSFQLMASELVITNFSFSGSPRDTVTPKLTAYFTVTWNNAWKNDKNNDAVWIFFKVRHQNETRNHRAAMVKLAGHKMIYNFQRNGIEPVFYVPPHRAGVLISLSAKYRGSVSWRLKIELDAQVRGIDYANIVFGDVFGVEMVQVPQGSFYIGESDTLIQNRESAFFDLTTKGRILVNSEKSISVGSEKGSIYYNNKNVPEFRGDRMGPVPDSFPKGFHSFYVMKYELSQGNYVSFLNTLGNQSSFFRSNLGGKEYYKGRGGIKRVDGMYLEGVYMTDYPERPANYISWDDGCAFADWAGLRPMTELEFEKAARGPANVLPGDYPWGSSSSEMVSRYYDREGNLVFEKGIAEKDLSDSNLEMYGASYFWVMDLGGSLWERVVTIGSNKGRSFKGTHGDGFVDQFGNATNADWPTEVEGGLGYRGGGYYDFGMAFGPSHTSVATRPYGSWGDGPRSVAYGFRACLSVQ